mmetsp:Transcript_11754/g.22288  ORF Transcript_11754/g.22288 Transcript_11754/m.22288 type:complete len:371 (+) Transcript_11754:899-2011(+)
MPNAKPSSNPTSTNRSKSKKSRRGKATPNPTQKPTAMPSNRTKSKKSKMAKSSKNFKMNDIGQHILKDIFPSTTEIKSIEHPIDPKYQSLRVRSPTTIEHQINIYEAGEMEQKSAKIRSTPASSIDGSLGKLYEGLTSHKVKTRDTAPTVMKIEKYQSLRERTPQIIDGRQIKIYQVEQVDEWEKKISTDSLDGGGHMRVRKHGSGTTHIDVIEPMSKHNVYHSLRKKIPQIIKDENIVNDKVEQVGGDEEGDLSFGEESSSVNIRVRKHVSDTAPLHATNLLFAADQPHMEYQPLRRRSQQTMEEHNVDNYEVALVDEGEKNTSSRPVTLSNILIGGHIDSPTFYPSFSNREISKSESTAKKRKRYLVT